MRTFASAVIVVVALQTRSPALSAVTDQTQRPTAPPQQFEVASVKISRADNFSISPYGTGTFTIRHVPLATLLSLAASINTDRITGGPGWLRTELYDVSAKAEDGVLLTVEEMRPRLRHLLEQRFGLVTHRETRQQQGYALVVARGGPKLKTVAVEPTTASINAANGLYGPNMPLEILAAVLQNRLGRPVIDETGITGEFNIALDYARDPNDTTRPSVFTALEEQLGLRLDTRTLQVEWLVIDRVEHPLPD
jgi:uncharacterized protein (TIGR03435 family)